MKKELKSNQETSCESIRSLFCQIRQMSHCTYLKIHNYKTYSGSGSRCRVCTSDLIKRETAF